MAATAWKAPLRLRFGTWLQTVPFQCSIRVLPRKAEPTAQALVAEVAATPDRVANVPGLGLGTRVQAVPFQCTINVLPLPSEPTAQALPAEVAATPDRAPLMVNDAAGPGDLVWVAAAVAGVIPATPASSSGTVRVLIERVASWGMRTGLPPPLGLGPLRSRFCRSNAGSGS